VEVREGTIFVLSSNTTLSHDAKKRQLAFLFFMYFFVLFLSAIAKAEEIVNGLGPNGMLLQQVRP
jgi:hypothetical protein